MIDDLVFFSTLVACIFLGSSYKNIVDVNMKRNYGAGLGLLVACLLCGHQIYHSLLIVWWNIIIIKCCDTRYLHHLSLAYTWTYLVYLHFHVTRSVYMHLLHQTIALRVVGLAFEVHMTAAKNERLSVKQAIELTSNEGTSGVNKSGRKSILSRSRQSFIGYALDQLPATPTSVDIITYSYFFIGLHRGPYYRWKIFDDHFRTPFGMLGDCRVITEQKIKKAVICGIGYLLLQMKYSSQVYYDDAFYQTYGDFRYLYSLPQLAMYFLHFQMAMLLCTSVCTETGFGVYPAACVPIPGHGPTTRLNLLNMTTTEKNVTLEQEYNFSMLKCSENHKILFAPKMKECMRAWDLSTRYWFWAFIYKNSIKANKKVRNAFSNFVWLLWMGPSLQNCIIAFTIWVHINLEAEFSVLYNTNDSSMRGPWNIGFSIMRWLCLIYLTPCLIVEDSAVVLKYYNSILWSFHIVLLILILVAIVVYMRQEKRINRASGTSVRESTSAQYLISP